MLILLGKLSKSFMQFLESNSVEHALVADTNSKAKIIKSSQTKLVEKVDFSNFDEVLETVNKLKPSAVITDYEHYIRTAARLNEALGLPGIPIDSANACTDKNLMRAMFRDNDPSISPNFSVVKSVADIESFINENELPVMLKPTNLVKSLFITKNDTTEEAIQNYQEMTEAMPAIYKDLGVNEEPEVIVEQFLEGSMHTVAGFADSNGTPHLITDIADIETGRDIGSTENFLYSRTVPSALPGDIQAHILEVARRGMMALKMKNSAAHIEIMLTSSGPKIIEIGARPGGYRPRMYSTARGINFYQAFIDAASGKDINLAPSLNLATSTIELFPEKEGTVSEISHRNELENLKTLEYLSFRIDEGKAAGLPSQGFKSAVIITLTGETEDVMSDKEFIDENVKVIV